VPLFFPWAASALGAAYTAAGRLGEGLPLLEEAQRPPTSWRSNPGATSRSSKLLADTAPATLHEPRRCELRHGPADGKWGDYLTCRRHPPETNTRVAVGFPRQGGGVRNDIEPRYVHFGR
jgi:hypothetical protein